MRRISELPTSSARSSPPTSDAMTPRIQNAVCRAQDARRRVGLGWGAPTWGLTQATVWCQKSVAGRAGNHDRRQSQDGKSTSTTDNGATVFRPAAGSKPVFSQQGGPRPRQPHKLVAGGFNSRPCSQPFGPFASRSTYALPLRTVGACFLSSTPVVSSGGFSPGLSARFVVWVHGVEVSISVVVPAGPFGGLCVSTTDCAGIGHPDAGALLFPGTRPGQIGTTWRKSRTNERSRKCRECRQPQPSPSNPESPSLPSPAPAPRSTRGRTWLTAIRSSCLRRPRSNSRRLRAPLGSGTGSRLEWLTASKTAFLVCGVGESRVGESTGLPRFTAWGALSGHVVHKGQRSLGLCWRDRQGRSVTRLPAILKNKTEVGQAWAGAPTVGPGNRGADAIESLSANQGSRSERNASDVSDAYWVRTGRNADEKHDLFLCRGVV